MRKLAFAALAATAFVTPAVAAPPPAGTCIRHKDLYNWSSPNNKTLIIEDNRHKKVLAHLIGACIGLRFQQTIAIRSPGASQLSCIEKGDFVSTREFGSGIRSTCAIGSLEPYTGELKPRDGEKQDGTNNASSN